MNENLTELVFVVDRSGSMCDLVSDTIGGFNATLEQHRAAEGDAVVSTVLFDNETEVLHDRLPIAQVANITEREYWVRGCTALLDAVGGAIRHIARVRSYLPEEYRPGKTIVVIITDGLENASRKYSHAQVKKLIEQKKEEGWEFLFLGANIDAVGEAGRLGISEDRAVTYLADGIGQRKAYEAVGRATCKMREMPCGATPMDATWKEAVEEDTAARGTKKHHRRGLFHR